MMSRTETFPPFFLVRLGTNRYSDLYFLFDFIQKEYFTVQANTRPETVHQLRMAQTPMIRSRWVYCFSWLLELYIIFFLSF